jgi:hypothetical protein
MLKFISAFLFLITSQFAVASLKNHSTLTGTVQDAALALDATSQWNVTSDSDLTSLTNVEGLSGDTHCQHSRQRPYRPLQTGFSCEPMAWRKNLETRRRRHAFAGMKSNQSKRT